MSEYRQIKLSLIVPDPKNRHEEFDIDPLAASILEHGLLENLVVRPLFGDFQIIAGERRWRAMRRLQERASLPADHEVTCLVKDVGEGEGTLLQLVENVQRLDPSPWHLGRRFVELCESGYSQNEIAARIQRPQAHVSRLAQIARGIAPSVSRRLDRLGPKCLTINELLSVARLCDEMNGEPDESAQLSRVQQLLTGARKREHRKPGMLSLKERVWLRYQRLSNGDTKIPKRLEAAVLEVLEFLQGKTRGLGTKKIPPSAGQGETGE